MLAPRLRRLPGRKTLRFEASTVLRSNTRALGSSSYTYGLVKQRREGCVGGCVYVGSSTFSMLCTAIERRDRAYIKDVLQCHIG